jgi:hypothetical protein
MQAAAYSGILAVAVLDATAERHLGQVALTQPRVLQRLGAGRAGEIERRDGQLDQSHIRREPAGYVAASRCRHQVVDVVACCPTGQRRDLSAAMQDVLVNALRLRHRDIVTRRHRHPKASSCTATRGRRPAP